MVTSKGHDGCEGTQVLQKWAKLVQNGQVVTLSRIVLKLQEIAESNQKLFLVPRPE